MKKILLSAAAFAVVAVSAVAVAPNTAEAVPAFARQTGAACYSCHFQAVPRLAAFGRSFRMNSFRDMGEQALIEDDHLSLPAYFNASLRFKARIQSKSNNNALGTGAKTAIQWPSAAAIYIGGRYGEHLGGITEWGGADKSTKIGYMYDLDNGVVGLIGGTTPEMGLAWLYNDPSNAISMNTRGWQRMPGFLMMSKTVFGGVTGIGAYGYLNNMVYFAVGGFIPTFESGAAETGLEFKPSLYTRVALTTEFGDFDTVLGGYYINGKLGTVNAGLTGGSANSFNQYGLDLQMQGEVGDVSVGFYIPVQLKGEDPETIAPGVRANNTGYFPVVTLAYGHLGVRAGYDYSKMSGGGLVAMTTKTSMLGAWYNIAQNVVLDLEYENAKTAAGSTNTTTLQLDYLY